MTFRTFTRTWWRRNPAWPNGLEPKAGRRHFTGHTFQSEEEARRYCREWNESHPPGKLSRKCEYERV